MTPRERMESGLLYNSADPELQAQQRAVNELVYDFNATRPSETERRQQLLREIFAEVGEGAWIEPPCGPTGAATPIWATMCTPTST